MNIFVIKTVYKQTTGFFRWVVFLRVETGCPPRGKTHRHSAVRSTQYVLDYPQYIWRLQNIPSWLVEQCAAAVTFGVILAACRLHVGNSQLGWARLWEICPCVVYICRWAAAGQLYTACVFCTLVGAKHRTLSWAACLGYLKKEIDPLFFLQA